MMSFKKTIFYHVVFVGVLLIRAQSIAQPGAAGRSYYISKSGDDRNAGTKNKPFQSIEKINGLHLIAGDTVYFKSGQVFKGSLLIIRGINGTRNKPVVFTSYGRGHAVINAGDSVGVKVYNGAFIGLRHLSVVARAAKQAIPKMDCLLLIAKKL
jgi:hypothetical protein